MTLIFSFSTHIGDYIGGRYTKDNKTDHILKLYKISMERAKSFGHKIKFYGCDYSLNYLKDYYDTFVNVEHVEFDITDDLKIYIHTQEPAGSITFDGDIILENKLSVDETSDIIFEQREEFVSDSPWQWETIFKMLNIFKKYKVDEVFPDFSFETRHLCNVGVLRFRTEEIKNLFIDSYYKFRRYYLTNIEPTEKLIPQGLIVSTIICQYYFTNICQKNNIKYSFTSDYKSNKYKHYLGNLKFNKDIFNIIDKELHNYLH
jgi:hypothetical protein